MEGKIKSDKDIIYSRIQESINRLGKNNGLTLFRLYKLICSRKGL